MEYMALILARIDKRMASTISLLSTFIWSVICIVFLFPVSHIALYKIKIKHSQHGKKKTAKKATNLPVAEIVSIPYVWKRDEGRTGNSTFNIKMNIEFIRRPYLCSYGMPLYRCACNCSTRNKHTVLPK